MDHRIVAALKQIIAAIKPINNLALFVDSMEDNEFRVILLYDPSNEKLIGGADIEFDSANDAWVVSGIYADKGWGPTLYLTLKAISEPHGLTASPSGDEGHTREGAVKVWQNFYDGVGKDLVTKEKLDDDRGHDDEALTYKYHPVKKPNWQQAMKAHDKYESDNPDIVENLRDQATEKWQDI